jgi:ABC-type lipoprotein release transport system permease subunit
MSKLWALAWRNLARNRRRNLATAMAITFGFTGIVLIAGYRSRVDSYMQVSSVYLQHVGHVSIYQKDGLDKFAVKPAKYGLTPAHQEVIAQVLTGDPRVDYFGRHLAGTGLAGNGCKSHPFIGVGMDIVLD